MTEEEIKTYWRSSADNQTIDINQQLLLMELTKQITGIDKKVKYRDTLEIAAAAVVGIVFSVRFYLTDSMQTKIGSGILILSCLLIAYKLLAARRTPLQVHTDTTTKEFLLAARINVQNQMRLLGSVLYWYLLPLYLGIIIVTTNFTSGLWIDIMSAVIYIPLLTWLYYKIYQMNQKAAKDLHPVLEKIEEALQQLEG